MTMFLLVKNRSTPNLQFQRKSYFLRSSERLSLSSLSYVATLKHPRRNATSTCRSYASSLDIRGAFLAMYDASLGHLLVDRWYFCPILAPLAVSTCGYCTCIPFVLSSLGTRITSMHHGHAWQAYRTNERSIPPDKACTWTRILRPWYRLAISTRRTMFEHKEPRGGKKSEGMVY